jgi:RimJ/RimL family protein N-acetyltransferase
MVPTPVLETPRLILRAPTEADFPAFAQLMMSERAQYMGGPFNDWGAWGMLCHDMIGWSLFGHGGLMIDRREDGICVGQVSINYGPLFPERELGWMLYDGSEGRGYATEAADAYRNWAFATLKLDTLVSYMDPANVASAAVAERLGGHLDPNAPRQDAEDLVYRYWPPGRA